MAFTELANVSLKDKDFFLGVLVSCTSTCHKCSDEIPNGSRVYMSEWCITTGASSEHGLHYCEECFLKYYRRGNNAR